MPEKIGSVIRDFKITKKKVLTIVLILILAGTGVRSFMGKTENTIAEAAPNKVYVKATVAESVIEQAIISYKASLEASEEGIVSGKVSGKVVQVMFKNGQYVTQGDLLIKLDDQDIRNNIASSQAQLKASESQVKSAESQLVASQTGLQKVQMNVDNAVRTYARMKVLFDGGAISKVELENSETTLTNAKSDLESAEANIELSRSNIETSKANLATAQVDLKILNDSLVDTKITAPITGIMDERNVSLGQYANMGVVLAKVKAISPIYAVIEVDQNDMSSLQVGQSAKVKVGSNVVKDYDGIIKSIEASADKTSRVFKCKVEVTNLDQVLKPGIYAKVDIVSDQTSEVIAVTTDALSGNPGNYTVFVIDQGVARKRIVSIGQISKGLVEIKDGVKNGDSVIITNVNTLQDGDAVSVVTE